MFDNEFPKEFSFTDIRILTEEIIKVIKSNHGLDIMAPKTVTTVKQLFYCLTRKELK